MVTTPSDPNNAQAWMSGTPTPDDVIVDFYIPRGNQGVRGPRGPAGPSVVVGSVETNMGPAAPGTIGPQGLPGAKGDPGGLVLGTVLSPSIDWDTITTPGLYQFQASVTGNGRPESASGLLTVTSRGTNFAHQEYTPLYGTASWNSRIFYRRWQLNGTWGAWQSFTSERIDKSAGLAIYTWDPIASREQLFYGDTGWRDISANVLNNDAASVIRIRRVLSNVYVRFNTNPSSQGDVFNFPTGFAVDVDGMYSTVRYSGAVSTCFVYTAGSKIGLAGYAGGNGGVNYTGTFPTSTPWPTTLPGTASGSIPNM